MSTKKMLNSVETAVDEMLAGAVASNPGLVKLENHRVVLRADLAEALPGRVAVVCGGGSGHEPAFAGYVGDGMLDASIAGSVFASPPATQILAAILGLAEYRPAGILVVVFNYTGDRVNFGLAVERAKAMIDIPIEIVTVGEDTALTSADRTAGRRGLAGGILFLKIVGGLAKSGKSLPEIVEACERQILPNLGTIGVCLRPCIVPGNDSASFSLGDHEMEVGLGVHGEAGILRTELKSAQETIQIMLARMTQEDSATRLQLLKGDKVVVLLNNLGAISDLEMGILVNEAMHQLTKNYSVEVNRVFSGRFMTSLEMSGFSLTVLKLSSDSILELVDMEAKTCGWCGNSFVRKIRPAVTVPDPLLMEKYVRQRKLGPESDAAFRAAVKQAVNFVCDALIESENELNQMDAGSGDADCGSTLARGAKKLKLVFQDSGDELVANPAVLFRTIGSVSEKEMGGSSGAMFSIFWEASASRIESAETISAESVTSALETGLEAVKRHGRARIGDRTLIDSLQPALESLRAEISKSGSFDVTLVANKAEEGAAATVTMKASAGRASYVNASELKYPDPGAKAVAIIFKAIASSIKG